MAPRSFVFLDELNSSIRPAINYTSGVGAMLWLANLVLLLNIALVISGTLADSAEFVSAFNESLVVEPFFIALANHTLSQFIVPTITLVLVGLLVKATAIAKAQITKQRRPIPYLCPTFPQPFVQTVGSRAPPLFS